MFFKRSACSELGYRLEGGICTSERVLDGWDVAWETSIELLHNDQKAWFQLSLGTTYKH